ncbi:MAG TPA: acetylornithine/succinylornithine family transaminase [Longimicrobiales bacterium]|nr:acetylornithine/succinylornithine family transaminase [Longimicrobiales bacterium]
MMSSSALSASQSVTVAQPTTESAGIGGSTMPAQSAVLGTYRPAPPVFTRALGCRVFDSEERSYLDFASGIGVNALGYGDAGVADALRAQLETGLVHTSNLYRTAPAELLARALVEHSFADRVFFSNSGAEANEAAFKFARRYAREVGGAAKHEIVALRGGFHGRLFGALAATDRPAMQEPFMPLMPGVHFIAPGDVADARNAISSERTAAIIVEPVQGEGGVKPLGAAYLRALRDLADAAGALLIFDEVQCGLARTGHLFAYQATDVTPDVLTLAKPLAGGLPMGATLVTERVAAAIRPGDHATTFGGGPLVAAVALHVFGRIADAGFLADLRETGAWLSQRLDELCSLENVTGIRGAGMMWGIELSVAAAPRVPAALENGLLVTAAGENVLRLLPPLVITPAEIDEGIAILREVLQ